MNIVDLLDIKKECCGCSACSNVCSVKAIEMVKDARGMMTPTVDREKCLECSMCVLKCPVINVKYIKDSGLSSPFTFSYQYINNIVNLLDVDRDCCGCSACTNTCPVSAINMLPNDKGFLAPVIDKGRCVDCGMCVQVCPVHNFEKTENPNLPDPHKYAYLASKDILSKSSSGGAFTVIARKILNQGGVVFGAAYNDAFEVEHIVIERYEDLDRIRGSKYVQSNQKDCYKKAEEYLWQGRVVLYSGTPCQIAGLKSYLRKDYKTLYTVDLLCHGVPSPKVYRDYLHAEYDVQNIDKIVMRDGERWVTKFDMILKNGIKVSRIGGKSVYINGFLRDLYLRDSCYRCHFASLPRQGDITLGDFWDAKRLKIGQPYESRSSIVLLNNEKGNRLWHQILRDDGGDFKDITEIDVKRLNKNIYAPNSRLTDKVNIFWDNYRKMDIEKAILKTLHPGKNVGLVLYASDNYGSCATNICLYKAVQNLGYNPIILDSLVKQDGCSHPLK